MKNKEYILSKLEKIIKILNETPQIDINIDNVIEDLKVIKEEVQDNL